jgi:hypothetical protein
MDGRLRGRGLSEPRILTADEVELSRRIQDEERARQARTLFYWALICTLCGAALTWFI